MTTVEILQEMRNKLLESGWCKGQFQDSNGSVCLVGSLSSNNIWQDLSSKQISMVWDMIHDAINVGVENPIAAMGIGTWNDKEERTFNEVLAVLDAAMVFAKEKE